MTETSELVSLRLYSEQLAAIARLEERYGMTFSAALRAIITEWDRWDRRRMTDVRPEYVTGTREA